MTILLGTGIGLTTSGRRGGGGPGPSFEPASLFSAGVEGSWYDVSDRSTLFQDIAGTVPVVADSDRVALIKDKSGNGHHLKAGLGDASRGYYFANAGRPYVQLMDSNGFLIGDQTIAYNATTSPCYIGAYAENGLNQNAATLAMVSGFDFRNILFARQGGIGWMAQYVWDGDAVAHNKPNPDTALNYGDMQINIKMPADLRITMDTQVDAAAGVLLSDSGPAWGNVTYRPALNTTNVAAASPIGHKFYGGIIVLRSLTQTERNSLRTYFGTPKIIS